MKDSPRIACIKSEISRLDNEIELNRQKLARLKALEGLEKWQVYKMLSAARIEKFDLESQLNHLKTGQPCPVHQKKELATVKKAFVLGLASFVAGIGAQTINYSTSAQVLPTPVCITLSFVAPAALWGISGLYFSGALNPILNTRRLSSTTKHLASAYQSLADLEDVWLYHEVPRHPRPSNLVQTRILTLEVDRRLKEDALRSEKTKQKQITQEK